MRTVFLSVLIPLLLLAATPSAAQLPPEIQADSYLLRAEQAISGDDHSRARAEIDRIILLQKEHELDLYDEFHFRYAKAAAAADLPEQAHEAVVKYLTLAGRDGKHYQKALELMNQVRDANEASKEPQEAANESTPPAQEVSQVPSVDQSGAGGLPEAPHEKRDQINAAGTAEAQPVPDCRMWNTGYFFRMATLASVTACLAAGADPAARNKSKSTPLHWAARYNANPAVIKALLAAGGDPMARDDDRDRPLHLAAMFNANPETIKALIDGGSNARAVLKWSALHEAAALNETPEAIEALLEAGADPAALDKYKSTPLHLAAQFNKNPAVIEALLKAEADSAALKKFKRTPLHVAAGHNENPAVIEVLLKAGADPMARDKIMKTPLHLAAWDNENPAVIEALLKAGADPMARDKKTQTPPCILRPGTTRIRPSLKPYSSPGPTRQP